MNKEKLKKAIEQKRKQNAIRKELKKRMFVKKYFDYEKCVKLPIYEKLNIVEDEFNNVFLQTFSNTQRYNIHYGGAGSGKSEFIARRKILQFLLESGHNGLFLRKFGTDVRRSIFELLKKVLNDYIECDITEFVKVNKSDMTFTFYNGNKIILGGLDDPEKLKSITFENGILTDVWLEEANQCNGTEIGEINRRLRGYTEVKKEITLSFNPVSKSSWLYKEYFNAIIEFLKFHQDEEKLILKTTVYDNKYATKEDIEQLEKQLDQYDKDVYLLGNFGVITGDGAIVPYNDAMQCITMQTSEEGEIYIGVDCAGMGNDNTVAMVRKGAVQLQAGFELSKAEEKEVINKLIELIQDLQRRYSTHVTVNIDTTGVGFGVGSQMRTANLQNVTINSIAFGGAAKENDRYFNIATELYFNVRELVMSKAIQLINDPETISELCMREYEIEPARSRRKIEPKDRFKKRIKKSPDKADALCLAFYVPDNKIPSFGYWE